MADRPKQQPRKQAFPPKAGPKALKQYQPRSNAVARLVAKSEEQRTAQTDLALEIFTAQSSNPNSLRQTVGEEAIALFPSIQFVKGDDWEDTLGEAVLKAHKRYTPPFVERNQVTIDRALSSACWALREARRRLKNPDNRPAVKLTVQTPTETPEVTAIQAAMEAAQVKQPVTFEPRVEDIVEPSAPVVKTKRTTSTTKVAAKPAAKVVKTPAKAAAKTTNKPATKSTRSPRTTKTTRELVPA